MREIEIYTGYAGIQDELLDDYDYSGGLVDELKGELTFRISFSNIL